MTPEQINLKERLRAFRVDSGEESLTFVRRLARENGWTQEYAERVFREYKRFAFLCVAAGHPCTPSDQVDQAWHLHLTYTHSYWDRFCGEVLQTPLHHNPTKGGEAEGQKFDRWYESTKKSYRRFFGEAPPIDIWPPSNVRFGDDLHYERVNTKHHWVIPKPRARNLGALSVAAVGVLALAGCIGVAPDGDGLFGVNTFSLFRLYAILMIPAVVIAVVARQWLKNPERTSERLPELNRYELAYLAGRNRRVFATAFVQLAETGVIAYDEEREVASINGPLPDRSPEPERIVYERIARSEDGIHVGQLRRDTVVDLGQGYDHLTEDGLILSSSQSWSATLMPMLIAAMVPVAFIGVSVYGILSEGHWGSLVAFQIFVAATGTIPLWALSRRPRRSRIGDRVLAREQQRLAERERDQYEQPDTDLSGAVALNGVAVLHATMFASMITPLNPPTRGADPGAGGGCGGCGDAGCGDAGGGDGGCGGGGCGGGGCGGCGGCGG